jgi:hypothetical protein
MDLSLPRMDADGHGFFADGIISGGETADKNFVITALVFESEAR